MAQWNPQANDIFLRAVEITAPGERVAYLGEACGENAELRAQVEALLAASAKVGSFLEHPADPYATGAYTPPSAPGATGEHVPQEVQPGYVIAGRYTLVEKLGEGGMGEVWVAKQTEPVKRKVALKLIKAGMDSKAVLQRFEAERQALALMDHPNIAKVLDGGLTEDRHPFFVMELVNGLALTKFCDGAKLSIKERLELFIPICQAVQHAHQKGIVHRDLKPSNILVTQIDGKPIPKVIDFGVAKATGGKLTDESMSTQFGAVVGTLEYMSPEQAGYSGHDIDTRADIYSLGVILYELLTGLKPFEGKRLREAAFTEMLRILKEEEPSKPSTRLSTDEALPSLAAVRQMDPKKLTGLLRGELDWVVMRCLEKQRDRRYETANSLARDIERYLADEPVEARPPSNGYRLQKLVRRNKGKVIAACLVLLALLAGMAGTTWGLFRAERSAEAERVAKVDAQEKQTLAEKNEKKAITAAEAEKTAKEQAQKRLVEIERGVELFAGMLHGISPRVEEKAGDPLYVQLRRKAEQAATQLAGEGVGDPLAVARLQTILGATLRELGSYRMAVAVLEEARATRERELGTDHLDTLDTLDHLAVAYFSAGKLPEAIHLYEQIRDIRVAKLGADHHGTLTTLCNLALAYETAGKLHEAIRLYEQVRDARVAKLGADHRDTLTTLHNLAGAYRVAGRVPEAIKLYEQIRDVRVAKLGADHPATLATLHNLATAYQVAGKLPEAIRLYEQVRDARVAKLGADHPDTLTTLNNLAAAYQAVGKLPEAIRLYEQVRDARVTKLGADHPDTLTTLNNLAGAYRAMGKLPETIRLLEQVRDARVVKLGADHPDTLTTLHNLATTYRDAGKLPEAIHLFKQVSDAQVAKLGADHPSTLYTLAKLAGAYQTVGKLPEALPLFEQAAQGVAKRNFVHQHAGQIIPETIRAYEAARQFDRAEAWQRRWLAVVKERSGADSVLYANELALLGWNLLQQKNWADAETILRECLAIREKKQPNTWTTFNTQSLLGGALLGQKKYAEAEPLLLQGYEGMKQRADKIPPQGKVRLTEALERLVALYDAWEKDETARDWRKRLAREYLETGRYNDSILVCVQIRKSDPFRFPPRKDGDELAQLLGEAYLGYGEPIKALQLFEEALKLRQTKLGADHPLTRQSMASLGEAYLAAGKTAAAIAVLEEVRSQLQNADFPEPAEHATARQHLARAYRTAGRLADAEVMLRWNLPIQELKEPDAWSTFHTKSLLGETLLDQKKNAEAEPLLLQGYEGMKQREAKIPEQFRKVRLTEALERLVQLYEATGKKDEAAKWRKELDSVRSAVKKP